MTTLEDGVIPSLDKLEADTTQRGTPAEFAELFEVYLDAVYDSSGNSEGRETLVATIAAEFEKRQVESVLDCACGSGFPSLDLAADLPGDDLVIHCTDADPLMIGELNARAKVLFGVRADQQLHRLTPPLIEGTGWPDEQPMVLDWAHLDHIDGQYDYVMCRGNSLVYASTWTGGTEVASPNLALSFLDKMVAKVKPGGYLHIDAPRRQAQVSYQPPTQDRGGDRVAIKETVRPATDSRLWTVEFTVASRGASTRLRFERRSTCLTIRDVAAYLQSCGFEETELVELPGERPGFAVVIAKKPE